MVLPTSLLTSIALLCASTSAFPIDGFTKRAHKVVGCDFSVVKTDSEFNETALSSKRENPDPIPLENKGTYYTVEVGLGSDNQKVQVQIDTGSSDLWVPGNQVTGSGAAFGTYNPSTSSSSRDTGSPFGISYADGTTARGQFYTDKIQVGEASVDNFQFAVAQSGVKRFGVFGIGKESQESTAPWATYANFPYALKDAGLIDTVGYSIFLNDVLATTGSILFGGKDTKKYSGDLVTLQHSGDESRLSVNLDSVTYGDNKVNVGTWVVLDTGATYSYLPGNIVQQVSRALGGDGSSFGFYTTAPCNYDQSKKFTFDFAGISIEIPSYDLIRQSGSTCVLTIIDNIYGAGNNILGDSFIRNAYTVYNLEDSTISFGKPTFSSESNIVPL